MWPARLESWRGDLCFAPPPLPFFPAQKDLDRSECVLPKDWAAFCGCLDRTEAVRRTLLNKVGPLLNAEAFFRPLGAVPKCVLSSPQKDVDEVM